MKSRALVLCLVVAVAGGSRSTFSVALVTHASVDRLWNVRAICERWRGSLAVAIFAPKHPTIISEATKTLEQCNHVISVIAEPLKSYPTNRLRNIALKDAKSLKTTHVFVIDADFWPSPKARGQIVKALEWLDVNAPGEEKNALVVPSFAIQIQRNDMVQEAVFGMGEDFTQDVANAAFPESIAELKRCILRCRNREPSKKGRRLQADDDRGYRSLFPRHYNVTDEEQEEEEEVLSEEPYFYEEPFLARAQRRRLGLGSSVTTTEELVQHKDGTTFRVVKRRVRLAKPRRSMKVRAKASYKVKDTVQLLNCAPFHHHGSTRFAQWLVEREPLRLDCFVGNWYEPFVVVPTPTDDLNSSLTPFFDERFQGYGKNKIEWITRLRASNFSFWTVPKAFTVHSLHMRSGDKRKWDQQQQHNRAGRVHGSAEDVNRWYFQLLRDHGLYEDTIKATGWQEHSLRTKHCLGGRTLRHLESEEYQCLELSGIASTCSDTEPGLTPSGACGAAHGMAALAWERIYENSRRHVLDLPTGAPFKHPNATNATDDDPTDVDHPTDETEANAPDMLDPHVDPDALSTLDRSTGSSYEDSG